MRDSVMVISKFNKLKRDKDPVPITGIRPQVTSHKQDTMAQIPIDQQYQIYILEELKAIYNLLKERL